MTINNYPLFILEGNGGSWNLGCQAILRATMAILDAHFGACTYINAPCSYDGPIPSQKVRKERLIHRCSPDRRASWPWIRLQVDKRLLGHRSGFAFERYLHRASAVFALGGDNFTLDYGLEHCRPQFEAAEVVERAKCPFILWGASVGPFSSEPAFEREAVDRLKRMTHICVRETVSRDYLAGLGVTENVSLVSDPAFALQPERPIATGDWASWFETGCIGLNLSPLFGRYRERPESWQADAADCVRILDQTVDVPILLIPHVFGRNSDLGFLRCVHKAVGKTRNPVALVETPLNACETKWVISQTSLFVGARTHATIAALSTNVPTISLGYSVKARGINRDVYGHEQWVIPAKQLTPKRLSETVGQLWDQRAEVHGQLSRTMVEYQRRTFKAAQYVAQAMERSKREPSGSRRGSLGPAIQAVSEETQ